MTYTPTAEEMRKMTPHLFTVIKCENCKWWDAPSDHPHPISKFKVCGNPKLNQCGFNEGAGGYSGGDLIPDTDNQAAPEAGDGNGGVWLFTGPNFGCIHFEPKDPCPPSIKS